MAVKSKYITFQRFCLKSLGCEAIRSHTSDKLLVSVVIRAKVFWHVASCASVIWRTLLLPSSRQKKVEQVPVPWRLKQKDPFIRWNLELNSFHGAEPFRSCQLFSYSRISQNFTEPEGSLPCSLEASPGPYPERD
jgi:hypothetical protein